MSPVIDVGDIPTEGKNLIIVADVQGVLHFRTFDADGRLAVAKYEPNCSARWHRFRTEVAAWWVVGSVHHPPSNKESVITAVTSILDFTRSQIIWKLTQSKKDVYHHTKDAYLAVPQSERRKHAHLPQGPRRIAPDDLG